jgi:nucleotide-binding universal stress UspA family protein
MPHDDAPVLFAYDGSDYARTAIEQAARELRPGRDAIVLSVSQPPAVRPLLGAPVPLPEGLADDVDDETKKLAAEGAELAREAGFRAVPAAHRGDPIWQCIVDAADHAGASVIVLGSHGRAGLKAVLLGSVAEAAARHTDRNVLIVHRPDA